mgnify:CR=1 FL=1
MHQYVVYGLGVHTEIPLWGDVVADCRRDVTVRWRRDSSMPEERFEEPRIDTDRADHFQFSWSDFGSLSIHSGTEIVVETAPGAEFNTLRHLVGSLGIGMVLHQRRILTLHASAVEIGDRAVAIAGPKGTGKSTLSAALQNRGHRLLSDDIAALTVPPDAPPQVRPGTASINLWPDSALATGHDPSALPRIWSDVPKVVGHSPATVDRRPVSLGAVIILTRDGADLQPRRLQGVEALAQMISQSHALRWVRDRQCLPWHLEQCRSVLLHVPMFRMGRGGSLDTLSELAQRVEELVACEGPPTRRAARRAATAGAL